MADPPAGRTRTTPRLHAYLLIAVLGTFAGLVFGRPELVAATAPLAVYVAAGIVAAARPRRARVEPHAPPPRVLEGERVAVRIAVRSAAVARVDLTLVPGPGLRPDAGNGAASALRAVADLGGGQRRMVDFTLRAHRWGAPPAGQLTVRVRERFGLIETELEPLRLAPLRVLPRAETLRELIAPRELSATVGSRVARARGEGLEFAEVRPFHAGDTLRRINWRVSARRDALFVSDRHPERNGEIVLFLDTFTDLGDDRDGTLGLAVRAACALAAGYLERRDRVGVVGFGGVLSGIGPRLGTRQLYRIVDTLVSSEAAVSYAHKNVRVVPPRLLPPKALIVALSPLVDERSIGALFDLGRRGRDLAVIELSPERFLGAPATASAQLARRLWRLRREAVRAQLEALAATVTVWDGTEPLQLPVFSAVTRRRAVVGGRRLS